MDLLADPMGALGGPPLGLAVPMIVIIGDSNGVGEAVTDKADPAFNVTTTQSSIVYDAHFAQASSDPPPFQDLTGNLRPYTIGSTAGMGMEISVGQECTAAGITVVICKVAVVGTTIAQWTSGSTYPTGTNLINQMISWITTLQTTYNAVAKAFLISLGTNDSAASGTANAVATNTADVNTTIRSAFPAVNAIAWTRINADVANTGANPFVSTVASQQDSAHTSDPTYALVNTDDLTLLSDHLHFTSDSYLVLGQRMAWAALDLMSVARPRSATVPACVGFGPATQGPSNVPVVGYGGSLDRDLELLVQIAASGAALTTLNTPTGWTLLDAQSTSGSGVNVLASIYSRALPAGTLAANSGHTPNTTLVVAGSNPINASRILTFRGPNPDPTVDVVQGSVNGAFSTSIALAQVVTTTINELVALVTAGYRSNSSTNTVTASAPGLTNVISVEQGTRDNINLSDSTTIAMSTGQKATAGGTQTANMTSLLNSVMAGWQVAIKP